VAPLGGHRNVEAQPIEIERADVTLIVVAGFQAVAGKEELDSRAGFFPLVAAIHLFDFRTVGDGVAVGVAAADVIVPGMGERRDRGEQQQKAGEDNSHGHYSFHQRGTDLGSIGAPD
jgi:hypothetical protein